MKRIITIFIAFAIVNFSIAQTTHDITVQSNTFTPDNLTIEVGDEVVWTNIGGSHNVNGTSGSYPNNPEGFGNSVGEGWTYSFTFTLPGTYEYHCDPHQSFGMEGVIIVIESTVGIEEYTIADLSVFPSPASDYIKLSLGDYDGELDIIIMDLKGSIVKSEKLVMTKGEQTLSIAELSPALYVLKIIQNDKQIVKKFIVE